MTNAYDASIQDQTNDQEPAPQQQQRGSPYDGMIAENDRGHRVVYRSNAAGRGRWVELNPAAADPDSRQALETEQQMLARLRDTSRLAEAYIEHNRHQGTGGIGQSPWVPAVGAPHRQAMQGLSAEMVRANVRPGMSGTMNSDAEQQLVQRAYPNEQASGDVNAERAVRILANRDVQIELVNQMEQWLTSHPNLAGFQEHWRQIEPQLRQQITAQHVRRFGSQTYGFPNLNDRGMYDRNAPPMSERPPAPQSGDVIIFDRDPTTGEVTRRR